MWQLDTKKKVNIYIYQISVYPPNIEVQNPKSIFNFLESLGYLLIYLLIGRLPWQGLLSHSKEDKYYKIKEVKKNTSPEELCQGLPPQFQEYVTYTRNLKYESNPDYNYLRNLFLTMLKNHNYSFDYYYDWDQVGLTNSEIKDKEKDNNMNKEINKNLNNEQKEKI